MSTRTSNIELLRILAALGVMILHWNYNGGLAMLKQGNEGGYYIFLFLECINICAVNLFMLITGYYMCRKKSIDLWKPLEMITQVVSINICLEAMRAILRRRRFSGGGYHS